MKNRNLPYQDFKLVALPNKIIKVLADGNFSQLNTVDMEQLFHALMFLLAYPQSEKQESFTLKKLNTLTNAIKNKTTAFKNKLQNSGLPFTNMSVQFTHDCIIWLQQQPDIKVAFQNFVNDEVDLSGLLSLTLNVAERAETSAGLNAGDLLVSLDVKQPLILDFLLNEFQKLSQPLVKDYLFDKAGLQCTIKPKSNFFSLAYNRFIRSKTFYHEEILKKFDYKSVLDSEINDAVSLSEADELALIKTIKFAMALTNRETDTVTYMDETTLQYFELERGISVAIYGMTSQRQLPFESYIGYTLFKNGFPYAYGGGWVFGQRAMFGINIFEWFRGGESGFVLCQLLRVYKQVFGVERFEVEPYQYGLDNPDGIASGAFWFYYRFGFRPVDTTLRKLAASEFEKIRKNKTYRSSSKTLLRFTESNIELSLHCSQKVTIEKVTGSISKLIRSRFKGNRLLAEQTCLKSFVDKLKKEKITYNNQTNFTEVALWSKAFDLKQKQQLQILADMALIKPIDPYKYQALLLKLLLNLA